MELLYAPILPVLAVPPLAFIPTVWFAVCYWRRRARLGPGTKIALLVPVVTWAAYGVYEIRMFYWAKTVIAPIRIDLLLLVPVLYLVLLIGIIACYRSKAPRAASREESTPG